jgi:hypothetical protein
MGSGKGLGVRSRASFPTRLGEAVVVERVVPKCACPFRCAST